MMPFDQPSDGRDSPLLLKYSDSKSIRNNPGPKFLPPGKTNYRGRNYHHYIDFDPCLIACHDEYTPLFKKVAEDIFDEIKNEFGRNVQKRLALITIECLLINIVRLLQEKPDGTLAFNRANGSYPRGAENPSGISRKILNDVIDILHRKRYVGLKLGFLKKYSDGEKKKEYPRKSRLIPQWPFIKKYITPKQETSLLNASYGWHPRASLIEAKIWHEDRGEYVLVRYNDDAHSRRIHSDLQAYNHFLRHQRILLPDNGVMKPERILVRRVFHDIDCKTHGRFYGPDWQQLSKDKRAQIKINGQEVVELDFSHQHPAMLYGRLDISWKDDIGGDIYTIPDSQNPGAFHDRDLVKDAFQRLINAKRRSDIRPMLEKEYRGRKEGNNADKKAKAERLLPFVLDNTYFKRLLDDTQAHHPKLASFWGSRLAPKLLTFDGQICAYVLNSLTRKKIPVLGIHDSFIVSKENKEDCIEAMKKAYSVLNLHKSLPKIKDNEGNIY